MGYAVKTPGAPGIQVRGLLREPGSILLVSCYELGHQPLGIASPMGFLERAGYRPDALDISVERIPVEKVARARLVGISVPMHTALRLGVRVAERIREVNRTCHICFYGLYATLNAEYLLDSTADSVIGGEYEMALVTLVEALDSGRGTRVDGVSVVRRPAGPVLARLPFPVPSRGRLPGLGTYAHLEDQDSKRLVGYVEASRGCLHMCLHCPIPPVYGGRFFVVPREIVLEDIRRLVQDGVTHITFGDPDFLNGPGHSRALVSAMHEEFPSVTFDCTIKVEHILENRTIFPEFKALGCAFIVSAVESFSDVVLANLEKGHTRADVFEALRILRAAGISLRPTFVSFTPWTTLEDYLEVLEVVKAEDLIDHVDTVQYTIRLLVPPGSLLLERPAIRPFLGPLDQASFHYPWIHPDPRMDHLHKDISAMVEEATREGEDPAVTFERVRALAYATWGGVKPVGVVPTPRDLRRRPPRLTEPWFC